MVRIREGTGTELKDDIDSAQRYRQRAEELRTIASETTDQKAKDTLLEIAEDYERMATTRERIDKLERNR
jgi:hypothetical protein